jgi:hypothetical protein
MGLIPVPLTPWGECGENNRYAILRIRVSVTRIKAGVLSYIWSLSQAWDTRTQATGLVYMHTEYFD